MARKTIFDDVFRTICQKMPHLLIPLINEVFGTNYLESDKIIQLKNERFERNGEIITDAVLKINENTYHIECQSSDDTTMIIRMAEYDFSIALESVSLVNEDVFEMQFPESCVVYLRKSNSTSRNAILNIRFQDGAVYQYKMNTICIQNYTKDEIFKKRLLMFLPFYILRYEKDIPSAKKTDAEKLEALVAEYESLFERLENETDDFTDLYNLSIRIINHVIKSTTVKRRLKSMGGKILQLESERLIAKGLQQGQQMIVEAIQKLRNGARYEDIVNEYGEEVAKNAMLVK